MARRFHKALKLPEREKKKLYPKEFNQAHIFYRVSMAAPAPHSHTRSFKPNAKQAVLSLHRAPQNPNPASLR
jgi:hypothetical protein